MSRGWKYSDKLEQLLQGFTTVISNAKALTIGAIKAMNELTSATVISFTTCTTATTEPRTIDVEDIELPASAVTVTITANDFTCVSGVLPDQWKAAVDLVTLDLSGSTTLEDTVIPVSWAAMVDLETITLDSMSMTAAQVDAMLISINAAVQAGMGGSGTPGTIDISTNAIPTAASSAARTALGVAGYTVTVDS